MLKHLDRYILKELMGPFFLGIFILLFILIMQQILKLMELVIDKGIDLVDVGGLFLQLLPSFFLVTFPMAVMMATVTTFNRLSADNEIIALHAVGVNVARLMRPVVLFALIISFLTLWMGSMAGSSKEAFKSLAVKLLLKRASAGLEAGQFNGIFSNMMVYVDAVSSQSELRGIFIFDQRNAEAPTVIVAKSGLLLSDEETETISLHLENGALHQNVRDNDRYQKMDFARYDLKIDFSEMTQQKKGAPAPSYAEIKRRIADAKAPDLEALRLLSDYYRRFLFSLASFIFCIIGVPLGIISGRITRVGGFVAGIVIILIYYMLMSFGDYLLSSQIAPPFFAAALPILVLLPLCFYLLKKVSSTVSPTFFGIASKRP